MTAGGRRREDTAVDIQTAGKTIQLILAPAVMVTACGILLGGMLTHYSGINDRIRVLAAERLDLALVVPADGYEPRARERITEIDRQVPMLIHRHRQVHHAILLGYASVTILIVSMFVIGIAALAHSDDLGTAALFVFLGGTAMLLVSGGFMAVEITTSQQSVDYEAMRVVGLAPSWTAPPAPGRPGA
jgi:hypothetical protein